MIRSGVAQVTLSSTPIHNLFIPNIDEVSVIDFNVTTSVNLTGIQGFQGNQVMLIKNSGVSNLALPANNVNSDPQNRFSGASTITPESTYEFRYDPYALLIDRIL